MYGYVESISMAETWHARRLFAVTSATMTHSFIFRGVATVDGSSFRLLIYINDSCVASCRARCDFNRMTPENLADCLGGLLGSGARMTFPLWVES
jgi:hypothetical protein